ncbi:MAG: ParB family protein [Microbacterium sp.]
MTRPTRRTSTLAGYNPVTKQPEAVAESAPAVEEQKRDAPAPKAPAARGTRKKVAFEQHPDDSARMRGAVMATMMQEPHRSLTDFINRAIMAEVERLEKKYNGGQPFPPVKAGVMVPGRRMGE